LTLTEPPVIRAQSKWLSAPRHRPCRLHLRGRVRSVTLTGCRSGSELFYLKGVSTGDFAEALTALLGNDADGLGLDVARLKDAWSDEHLRGASPISPPSATSGPTASACRLAWPPGARRGVAIPVIGYLGSTASARTPESKKGREMG